MMRVEVDGVLDDVALGFEIREYVDRRIRYQQRLFVSWHIHDEGVADAARCPKAGGLGCDAPHQLIRVKAALHQDFAFPLMDELHAFFRRVFAMRRRDDLEAAYVQAKFLRDRFDFLRRPNKHRLDELGFRGLEGAPERGLIARMHDDRFWRLDHGRAGHEPRIFFVRRSFFYGLRTHHWPSFLRTATGASVFSEGSSFGTSFKDSPRNASHAPVSPSPKSSLTLFRRSTASPVSSPLASKTFFMESKACCRCAVFSGRRAGNRLKRRFRVEQQHEELIARHRLEFVRARAEASRPSL